MATTYHSNGSGSKLLSISAAADELGLSIVYLRLLSRQGKIPSVRYSPSSHRRFRLADLKTYQGIEPQASNGSTPLALVARVSGRRQAKAVGTSDDAKSSLQHQIDRLESFVSERFGAKALSNATRYYEQASGMNFERKQLVRLLTDVIEGKYRNGFIVATSFDRIVRLGRQLIEMIARIGECQILYSHPAEETGQDSNAEMCLDLMSILAHYSARVSGNKARQLLRIELDGETLKTCIQWTRQGYSYRWQSKELARLGIKDVTGEKKLSGYIIRRAVLETKDFTDILESKIDAGSFADFAQKFLRRTGNASNKLIHKNLKVKYSEWADKNGHEVFSDKLIAKHLASLDIEGSYNGQHMRVWLGVSLQKNEPSKEVYHR